MATKRKTGGNSARTTGMPSGGLLHKSLQPGNDGYAYLYHWLKFVTKPPVPAKGKAAGRLMRSDTTVAVVHHEMSSRALTPATTISIVDHSMSDSSEGDLVCLDLKAPKSVRASGQFVAHMLPAGTTRKDAEAWITSKPGKAWAGDEPTALAALAIRIF